ncbi:MAG: sulfotransferase domain-containing protein [Acidimicrobiia bacterium]|nr:sulfotransferase domain-containing protein [Acidimicrobiia bacterium]
MESLVGAASIVTSTAGSPDGRHTALWETGPHTLALIDCLGRVGLPVSVILTTDQPPGEFNGVPVVRADVPDRPAVSGPVVLGHIGSGKSTAAVMGAARSALGRRQAILHPCVLVDSFRRASDRWLVAGLPGSGNVVLQALLQAVVPHWPVSPEGDLDDLMVALASDYVNTVTDVLLAEFDEAGRGSFLRTTSHRDFGAVMVNRPGHTNFDACFYGLPLRASAWPSHFTSSHEPVGAEEVTFYRSRGYRVLQILRHPLDIIVSCAAKITEAGGTRAPEVLVGNLEWFESMVHPIADYLAMLAGARDQVCLVTYRQFLADQLGTARQVCEAIGIQLTDKQLRSICRGVLMKPLSIAPKGHFWAPGVGKWRRYLTRAHLDVVRASSLWELTRSFGFEIAGDLSGPESPLDLPPLNWTTVAAHDQRFSLIMGKRPVVQADGVVVTKTDQGVQAILEVDPTGGEDRFAAAASRVLRSELFRDLIASAHAVVSEVPSTLPGVLDRFGQDAASVPSGPASAALVRSTPA